MVASKVNTAKPRQARLCNKGARPIQPVSEVEMAGPKWAEDLRDVVRPASTVPETSTAAADLATPDRNAIEPTRIKLLSNRMAPKAHIQGEGRQAKSCGAAQQRAQANVHFARD